MVSSIFKMFGRSPIKPLEQHMAKAFACANCLVSFFDAVNNNDWASAKQVQAQISSLENEADDMKRDLRLHLPKGLFLPVPRSDLLELLTMQDRIANKAKDIAGVIIGRQMSFPSSLQANLQQFLTRSLAATEQANKAIHEMDELLETGFQGSEVEIVNDMIIKLNTIEHDTDELQAELCQQVFALEPDLAPVNVMFLYRIIDWIGDLADHAQEVGARLQLLIAS